MIASLLQRSEQLSMLECDLSFYEGDCGVLSLWASKDMDCVFVKLYDDMGSATDELVRLNLVNESVAEQLRNLKHGWYQTSTTFRATSLKPIYGQFGWTKYHGGIQ